MKIKSIEQWGTNPWNSMESAFHGCANLMGNATDAPDLSGVTVMSNMLMQHTILIKILMVGTLATLLICLEPSDGLPPLTRTLMLGM